MKSHKCFLMFVIVILLMSTMVVSADSNDESLELEKRFTEFVEVFNQRQLTNSELIDYREQFLNLSDDNKNLYVDYLDIMVLFNSGEFSEGFVLLELLLNEVDKTEDNLLYREILLKKREISWFFWDIKSMLSAGIELKEFAEENQNLSSLIKANYTLADVYYYFYDNENAIKLLDEAFALSFELDEPIGLANYYYFIGDMDFYSEEYDKALKNYILALEYAEKDDQYYITASLEKNILSRIAETYALLGATEEGLAVADKLINETDGTRSHELMFYYNAKGVIEKASGNFKDSITSFKQALEYHGKTQETPGAEPFSIAIKADLADAYFENANYKEAAELYVQVNDYYQYGDETSLEETASQLGEFESEHFGKQLSLAEQLQLSQEEAYKMQRRNLIISNFAVLLLIAVIGLVMIDVRIKKKSQKELFIQSITDHLTKVLNRGRIIEVFEEQLNDDSAVIMMDIDDFKTINDTYGHVVGDNVLKKIAEVTKESIRVQDHIGRYGGEEFLVVLEKCDLDTAKEIAERIRVNIESIEWTQENLVTTASIGVVLSKGNNTDEVLHDADMRMYDAKRKGKNCVVSV